MTDQVWGILSLVVTVPTALVFGVLAVRESRKTGSREVQE